MQVYLLNEARHLKWDNMKTLTKKSNKIKKAIDELKFISHHKKLCESYEAHLVNKFFKLQRSLSGE